MNRAETPGQNYNSEQVKNGAKYWGRMETHGGKTWNKPQIKLENTNHDSMILHEFLNQASGKRGDRLILKHISVSSYKLVAKKKKELF